MKERMPIGFMFKQINNVYEKDFNELETNKKKLKQLEAEYASIKKRHEKGKNAGKPAESNSETSREKRVFIGRNVIITRCKLKKSGRFDSKESLY